MTGATHTTTITRRGSGWGFRCSCGHSPNRSSRRRRDAERWADQHRRTHEAAS